MYHRNCECRMLQNGQPIVFSGHFFWVRAAAPLPHFTPIGIYVASPSHWNPKYATEWICQTSTKWSCKVCVSTCCGQGHNSPQIHNIQQQAVQHTTIHTESNKANISGDDCNLRMTIDLLTYWPQSWSFHALARWALVSICIKSVQSFSKYHLDKFGDRRMDGQTIKQVKNTLPLSASLAWWRHYESWQFQ